MRFTEEQLCEAKKIIAPFVSNAHCETFNSKIPLSVLTSANKLAEVNCFHEQLLSMCVKLFKDFKFQTYEPRVSITSSGKPAIFFVWLNDGKIPDIVRYCLDSFDDNTYEPIVITKDNMSKYIDVNVTIQNAYANNRLCPADYSDYIRIKLLEKYNGIYFDITTLFVNKLPIEAWSLPYWSVKGDYQRNTSPVAMLHFNYGQVYALGGYDNRIYSYIRQMFDYYFKDHDYAFSYYMVYYFFEYAYRHDSIIKTQIDIVPNNNEDCEQLAYMLDTLDDVKSFKFRNTSFYKLRSSDKYTKKHFDFFDKL